MTLNKFEQLVGKEHALGEAREFLERLWVWWKEPPSHWPPQGSVLFYGPTGVGKTHLAAGCCLEAIHGGVFSRFVPSVRIPREDQDAVLQLADPDEVPLLVLDDLGAERGTHRLLECLHTIIDGRIQHGGPMVVTTNFDPDELARRFEEAAPGYGDRLVSRLRGACKIVPVGGDDMRLQS